jgi:tRNA pseudouridine55 synthase
MTERDSHVSHYRLWNKSAIASAITKESPKSSRQMVSNRTKRALHGWLVLDKPLGMSSTQALGKARWLLNAEKAGHGGTLDPLASGVLPLAFGEATKTVNWAMDGRKSYRFTAKWGSETSTDDLEGAVTQSTGNGATQQSIEAILKNYIGEIDQTPPAYSAIKVDGERAYDLARAGETVTLKSRKINIDSLQIENHAPDNTETTFRVSCGKGTYVRSIARDIGRELGCLAHVTLLRRLAVGPFTEKDSISLETLEKIVQGLPGENSLTHLLRPIETVLVDIPVLAVTDLDAKRLQQGQSVLLPEGGQLSEAKAVLITSKTKPLGLFSVEKRVLRTIRLFNLID